MKKWIISRSPMIVILIAFKFIVAFGESDKPLLNQPFVVQNWSLKVLTMVNGSASNDSLWVHDDIGNGARRIAPFNTLFNDRFATKTTDNLPQGVTNKYDQTVSITGSNGLTVTGAYPNFTISRKRQETYSGTTNASGQYTVTFSTSYSAAPNIQANLINGADNQNIRITAISTTGFTVLARTRVDVIGLLPTWNNATGIGVDVLITEK